MTTTRDAVLEHLKGDPTIGLRELGRQVGKGRTATHRAVRQLVAAGTVRIVRLGSSAEWPSTYQVVDQ